MKKAIVVLLLFIVIFVALCAQAAYAGNKQKQQKLDQAESIAVSEAYLVKVTDSYLYNGKESWRVVTGENKHKQQLAIWIPEDKKGKIQILDMKTGITKKEARMLVNERKNPQKIIFTKLAFEDNIPLWEVTYKNKQGQYGYYYLYFETGEKYKIIDNL